jgi:deoxyadenosine/deoxycytidine kinase
MINFRPTTIAMRDNNAISLDLPRQDAAIFLGMLIRFRNDIVTAPPEIYRVLDAQIQQLHTRLRNRGVTFSSPRNEYYRMRSDNR